jgi:hypothetical protein
MEILGKVRTPYRFTEERTAQGGLSMASMSREWKTAKEVPRLAPTPPVVPRVNFQPVVDSGAPVASDTL